MEYTKLFINKFEAFVGLYNKLHGTNFSVKEALKTTAFLTLFAATARTVLDPKALVAIEKEIVVSPKRASTKRRSMNKTDLEGRRREVYDFIETHPGLTRKEIADKSGLFLQTVCGRVSELIESGLVYVSGEKYDKETDRYVEILAAK